MRVRHIDGQDYRLPNDLNAFQEEIFVHLIDWKWKHITKEVGWYEYKKKLIPYDAILPESCAAEMRVLYPPLVETTKNHHQKFPFRIHEHFNHMASSQAANINLFLSILLSPCADNILSAINPSYSRLATEYLDHGWRIEYWDEPVGALADKSDIAGTDTDLAIAYYDHGGRLCLWLIEHKLTEPEFSTCGGFRSEWRTDKVRHDCTRSFTQILENKSSCYYHDKCGYNYWDITDQHRDFFPGHDQHEECPFRGGMNQLWRNQLLGLAIEDEGKEFKHAHFSVVRHPGNTALDASLADYQELIANNSKFSTFTSEAVITSAEKHGDADLKKWSKWYRDLYML